MKKPKLAPAQAALAARTYTFVADRVAGPLTGTCERCGTRPASQWWVGEGGALAFVHGQYATWCERCCVEEQLRHARDAATHIEELEARLQELP